VTAMRIADVLARDLRAAIEEPHAAALTA
jgi:hypothetical protein